ncbi:acyltransferase [Pedobacter aquatilis]|uniref:acyltransferase family protein n=1 Tax=Pedobacter aquatilis TaxID=351343 RepID=UPI0029311871|nr:acyltransferase [Pedobacter aquatilis]
MNIIRATASMGVAIFHLGGKVIPILNYGWLGVQMFFVLTGFVICWSLPANYSLADFPKFLYKRIMRIEPPYIFSIILVLVFAFINNQNLAQISLTNILFHIAYLNNFFSNDYLSPVYWTLGIEFQFYLLIGAIFPFIFKNKYVAIVSMIILNLITFFFAVKYSVIINYIPFFTIGILIYLYKKNQISGIELCFLLGINAGSLYLGTGYPQTIAACLTGAIILFIKKSNKVIDFFSKISFSLYLTHDIIGSKIVIFLGNIFPAKNFLTKSFAFSIGLTSAVVFAYLFYLIIEKKFFLLSKKVIY